MKFKFKPFFVFEHDGNMYKCDKNGEIELSDENAIKKAKTLQPSKKNKKEVKDANMSKPRI